MCASIGPHLQDCLFGASLVAQMVKNLPARQETRVQSLGWEDPLEMGMAIHSRILAGESHGQRRLAGCSPWGDKESDMTELLALWGKGAILSNKASGGEGREASLSSPGQRHDTQVASHNGSWQPTPCVSSPHSQPSA